MFACRNEKINQNTYKWENLVRIWIYAKEKRINIKKSK